VDADAEIKQYPALFDELSNEHHYDVAAAFHKYVGSVGTGSLLSGTLWFQNNQIGKAIANRWHQIGLKNPDIRHQHCLRLAVDELLQAGNLFFIYRLHPSYTYIYDYEYGGNIKPVILHKQASRRLRKEVGDSPLRDSNFTAKQGGYIK
jgi:hypothetical protein